MSVPAPRPADKPPVDPTPPPPPQALSSAPQIHHVVRGDTVMGIAQRYGTSVDAIVKANPQKLVDPSRLLAGDQLTIPPNAATANAQAASPDTPQKPAEQQRTDQAVADLKTLSAPGQPRDKGRTDDIAAAQDRLDQAVDAEVKARVNAPFEPGLTPQQRKQLGETKPPTTEIAAQARADIVARHSNDAAVAPAVQKAVDTQEATTLVADNDRAGYTAPRDKLAALDGALGRASSPAVRDIAAAQPGYAKTVQDAANWAAQPYAGIADGDLKGAGQQAQDASQRVSDVAGALTSPTLRAQFVDASKPTLDKALQFASDGRGDHALQAATAFGNVSDTIGAIRRNDPAAASSLANSLAGRYSDQFKNMAGVIVPPRDAMAYAASKGADPTLALAVVDKLAAGETNLPKDPRPNGIKPPSEQTKQAVLDGVARYGTEVDKDLKAYTDQTGELNSLIAKEGANATPDQLNKAIENYKQLKGAGWEQQTQQALDKLADDGCTLLAQQAVLGAYAAAHPNDPPAIADTLNKVFADPANQAAIRLAVQKNPALIQGGDGKSLIGLYAQVGKSLDQGGRKLVQELGENYVKGRVDTLRQGLRGADTDSLRKTLGEIDALGNDKALPIVLGVSDGKQVDLKAATDALKTNISKNYSLADLPMDPKAVVAATQKNLGELDGQLNGIKAFDKGSTLGAAFRLFSVGAAGLSVASAYDKAGTGANTEEHVRNDLSLLVSAAGFTQKTAGLVTHIGLTDASSTSGKVIKEIGARTVDRVINGLSGAIDLWKAGDAFLSPNGDKVEGALYATTGAGSLLWAFGTGSWAGPVGIGLVAVGTVGLIQYQDAKANSDAQPGREAFLKGENFNDGAAKALAQRHSDGDASPVPMLMRYGALHHLDAAQTTAWFNGLSSEQQTFFAGALAKAQDSVGGDPGKFDATAGSDGDLDRHANDLHDLSEGWTGSVFGTVPSILIAEVDGPNREVTPASAHQLDAILTSVLDAKPPGTP